MRKCIICIILTFVLLTGALYVNYEKAYAGPEVAVLATLTGPEIALLCAAAMGVVIVANPEVRKAVGQALYDSINQTLDTLEPLDKVTDQQMHDAWLIAQENMRNGKSFRGNSGGGSGGSSGGSSGGYGVVALNSVLLVIEGVVNNWTKGELAAAKKSSGSCKVVSGVGDILATSSRGSYYNAKVTAFTALSDPVYSLVTADSNGVASTVVLFSSSSFNAELNGYKSSIYNMSTDEQTLYERSFTFGGYNFTTYDFKSGDGMLSDYMFSCMASMKNPYVAKIDMGKSVLDGYTDTTGVTLDGDFDFTPAIQGSTSGTPESLLDDLSTGTLPVPKYQGEIGAQPQTQPTTAIPTPTVPTGTPTDTTKDSDSSEYGVSGLKRVFPFCIPFDFYDLICSFSAEPEAPHFHVPFPYCNGVEINLSEFDGVASILRDIEVVAWLAGLMYATSRFIKW